MEYLEHPIHGKTTFSHDSVISSYIENGTYQGHGRAFYSNNSLKLLRFNDIVVHTPVIAQNIQIIPQEFINQKTVMDEGRIYLQLDGEFEVKIPDSGKHIDEKGYGTRDYNSVQGENGDASTWGAIKDVKLPFDAYVHNDNDSNIKYFLPKDTWLSDFYDNNLELDLKVSRATKGYKFTIPVWVEEKYYQNDEAIEVRVIAENALDRGVRKEREEKKEEGANLSIDNYAAYQKIPVEVLGEIYDLQVTHSNDIDWKKVQSGLYDKEVVLANEFPFGNTYSSNTQLSQNANAAYKLAPKLGYTATISLKTKGRKSNNIEMDVTGFSFVSKSGGNSQEVDLWYKPQVGGNYVKIVPGTDASGILLVPSSETVNVDAFSYVESSQVYSKEKNSELYGKYYYNSLPYNYSLKIDVGGLGKVKLPHQLRFTYDNLDEYYDSEGKYKNADYDIAYDAEKGILDGSEIGYERILGSVGEWHGTFGIPNTAVAVTKGSNPNSNSSSVLKNGYILVSLDISSKYYMGASNRNYDYLNYKGPEARYKKTELAEKAGERKAPSKEPEFNFAGTKTIKLENGRSATIPASAVLMYESDYMANVDSTTGGRM